MPLPLLAMAQDMISYKENIMAKKKTQKEFIEHVGNEYSVNNNIKLLRMPYTKFDKIEMIISEFHDIKERYSELS
jgi:hypothetical protein